MSQIMSELDTISLVVLCINFITLLTRFLSIIHVYDLVTKFNLAETYPLLLEIRLVVAIGESGG